jgi:putative transposase
MKYDPLVHHRRSIRFNGYNYAQPGSYFVTLATIHREHLFGEIIDDNMRLDELGEIIVET